MVDYSNKNEDKNVFVKNSLFYVVVLLLYCW